VTQERALALPGPKTPLQRAQDYVARVFPDPRLPISMLLAGYLILGFTVLGFNRSPLQVILTTITCMTLELFLHRLFKGKWIFPYSAMITSMGLSLLLNYSHGYWLLLFPAFVAIASKYVFTLEGRHVYNPAQIAVVASLLFTGELITAAPAYQWNGTGSMAYFILFPALMLFMPTINRLPLVASFLISYTILTALRAWIMRHHLPFNTLFWGTISSPSFLLFTFFMITDPATSPKTKRMQIGVGIALAVIDLALHLKQSYYTFFFAAAIVATSLYVWRLGKAYWQAPSAPALFRKKVVDSGYWRQPALIGLMAVVGWFAYTRVIHPRVKADPPGWAFERVDDASAGLSWQWGDTYAELDPRMQHVAKWILSVGSASAAADIDNDGWVDLCFVNPLSAPRDRVALYRNKQGRGFERVRLPAIEARLADAPTYGIPTFPVFADFDNAGKQDLFISFAFGRPVLLSNQLPSTGKLEFKDITLERGLDAYTASIAAAPFDPARTGRLGLWIANVLPRDLPDYDPPRRLNLFKLPAEEYPGDERPYHFMHSSWNNAKNGGKTDLFLQNVEGRFERQDNDAWGIPNTGWALALGASDLNQDGWPDMYVANDFGPDVLYFNTGGRGFRQKRGTIFGSIGRDTYKGMNVSIADFQRDGWLDVHVSNVHHDLQAEGNLFWSFRAPEKAGEDPVIEDEATRLGILNERRFGWGATAADFDNDGWPDLAQANGMVDNLRDKKWEDCPDYWYVNEKIARSPPSIHSYAHRWGDIRGMCIHGFEKNRVYMNRGKGSLPQFVDVADLVGLGEESNYRGMSSVDLDNDGRMDLVVTSMFRSPQVYMNREKTPSKRQWVGFRLAGDGLGCNADAIGSRARLRYKTSQGEVVQTAEVQSVTGFSAQGDRRVHFGLGAEAGEASLEVTWCGRETHSYPVAELNRYHEIKQAPRVAGP
jgi:Na+-translocating ferredoxin:NAD+ oxidoreductase RnfD subunit